MSDRTTVVFGLDGAHFELLEPWLEAGELPNVQRAIESGVTGDLQSVLPPVTSPNWKAYATGKNPGKIGIYWWENVDTDEQRVYYPHHRKHVNTEFWELLGEETGAGVVGVPTTYPPKSIEGFLVAGAPDGDDVDYTSPPELETELEAEFDYSVLKERRLADDVDVAAEEILDLIDLRFTVAKELLEENDVGFLQVTTFYINSLHHFLWDHEYTLEGWKIIDDHLGDFLDEDYDVVLMSDHGSNEIQTVFHVNTWLEREGYLTTDTEVADTLHSLGITTDRLIRLASKLGVHGLVKRLAPRWVLNYVPNDSGEVKREGKTANVDWEQSEALASGQGPIYLTVDESSPQYERLRSEIVQRLESLTDPQGRPVATAVHRGEEIYEGEYLSDAPDLVIEQASNVHISGNIGRQEVFSAPTEDGWRGENKRSGLFVATGPSFNSGTVDDISILDLAPTLLHLNDVAIPEDMDGEVQVDVFDSESDPATRAPSYSVADARTEERERIRRIARNTEL